MSKVRQLSVFIANQSGRVSEVTQVVGDAGINIRGFSVSDTVDYGILRLVVDDPDRAHVVLKEHGFTAKETDVICVKLPDEPRPVPAGMSASVVISICGVRNSSSRSASRMMR